MRQDILDLLETCVLCKKNTSKPAMPKSVFPTRAMEPFKQWALDIVGPLPEDRGNCGKFDSLVIDSLKLDSLVVDTIVK
ncbi:hypothetical protein DSO57_1016282 [Entomophthora muscae]|uniref:Uncharacterized protein n=1 Tax=Entomophthora muscae TaxID=34485 RepID=A0ACC2T580_9FUNG|nr:hypothetical protein DSO57_1016282 [Entomophthora muscae]